MTNHAIRFLIARGLAMVALGVGLGALIGYACGQPALLVWYRDSIPIALPTAVAITLLAFALLLLPSPLTR